MRSGTDWLTEEGNATARAERYEPDSSSCYGDTRTIAKELAELNANLSGIGHLLYELLAYVQRIGRTT